MRHNTTADHHKGAAMVAAVLAVTPPWLTVRAARELAAAWIALFAAVAATGLGLIVFEPAFDQAAIDFVTDRRGDIGVAVARSLTVATQAYVVFPVIVIVGLLAARRVGFFDVLWVPALAVGGGFAISVAVKFVVSRPRPEMGLAAIEAFGPAFPSGHAIRATAVAGAVAWLVSRTLPRATPFAWPVALVLAAVIAASRVYQGAHWPSDVLVGALVGIVWLAVVIRFAVRDEPSPGDPAHRDPGHSQPGPHPARPTRADSGDAGADDAPTAPRADADRPGEPTGA